MVIAGGGLAGLATAVALREVAGLDIVHVFERASQERWRESGTCTGLRLTPNGLKALEQISPELLATYLCVCVCVCVCVYVCVCVCVFFTSAWLLLQYSFTSLRIYMLRSLYYCYTSKAPQVSTTAPGARVWSVVQTSISYLCRLSISALNYNI